MMLECKKVEQHAQPDVRKSCATVSSSFGSREKEAISEDAQFLCPKCSNAIEVPVSQGGSWLQCPSCREVVRAPGGVALDTAPWASHQSSTDVVVTDIKMRFGSMVVFMVKWALASIPAMIILVTLTVAVVALVSGGLTGILRLMMR